MKTFSRIRLILTALQWSDVTTPEATTSFASPASFKTARRAISPLFLSLPPFHPLILIFFGRSFICTQHDILLVRGFSQAFLARPTMSRFANCLVLFAFVSFTAFSQIVSSHMLLASPKPIEGAKAKSPLIADGSNFPCHGVSLPNEGGQTMEAGSSFSLRFDLGLDGSHTAVHGGGSCQVAITYETDAEIVRSPSNWYVIYSIEGGCPSSSTGDLRNASYCLSPGQAECVHTWEVPLPAGLRSGHAILSWTWFNAIGEREMYQNCANVEIIGGTGKAMESLPAMYVANIGPEGTCTSAPERTNVAFPDPGEFRTAMSATEGSNWPSVTGSCSIVASQLKGEPQSGAATDISAAESPMPSSEKAYRSSGDNSTPEASRRRLFAPAKNNHGFLANPSSRKARLYSGVSVTASVDTLWSAVLSTTCDMPPTSTASSTCPLGSVSCSLDDLIVCIGHNKFGLCNDGCAQIQALAPGATCSAKKMLDK